MTHDPRWSRGRFACHVEPSVSGEPPQGLLLTTIPCGGSYRPTVKNPNLRAADRAAEELRIAERLAAVLALDRERGAEGRPAGGAAAEHLASALQTRLRYVGLELLEPPPGRAAAEADGGPVAEYVPALLAQPVGSLAHQCAACASTLTVAEIFAVRSVSFQQPGTGRSRIDG